MAKIAKVTDLTKLEGDPDPSRADVQNPRMYLEFHARGPRQLGFLRFIAWCSERSPVARALVVSILLVAGLACTLTFHFILAGVAPGWVAASVPIAGLPLPAVLYWLLSRGQGA